MVNNKRDKFTTLIAAVGAILADLSTGSGPQRLAGLHVLVGRGVNVYAREVEQNGAVGHGDMAVRKDSGQILGDKMARALVISSETQEELAGTIVAHKDRLALEHFAAESMPRVCSDVANPSDV